MSLLEIMQKRRSIRKFTGEAIPDAKLRRILQAGLLAPTSRNRKPCELYVIQDRETLKQLSKAKQAGGGFLADAPAAIVVFGDEKKADTWIEDCSIALTHMMLMATEEGIGNCWVQIHLRSTLLGKDAEVNVREILGVPESYRVAGILALGGPAEEPRPYMLEGLDYGKIHGYDMKI
ncbi:MAG: nitroreductase family protein [Clostridia bacterium]|nr:nitroreductase family protein [Clostridia bacterium]MBQ9252156.1 nitroreductase family protein [Clostridia bacterium]